MKNLCIGIAVGALALLLISSSGMAQPAPVPAAGVAGRVVETMNASTYTYVLVDDGTRQVWAAGPLTAVAVGDHVSLPQGMVMKNFSSKTLGRTFEEIYFVGSISVRKGDAPQPRSAHRAVDAEPATGPRGPAAPAPVDLGGIPKAAGGQTVAEILGSKATGAGKQVTVRARVIKITPAVMGKNWLHVQDASGASADLTVTTTDTAKVGDTVLVRGTLGTDRDFGAGYRYDVIVEDATVAVE